jgi:tetraacyldisaccharide 4'-kinase
MKFLRALAFPLAILYGIITFIRNKLYDSGILSSARFDLPVICVGNLSVGGTGKTPHIEYLIRLLKTHYKTATLSRGYGRSSEGFRLADRSSTSRDIGDEPLQFRQKFGDEVIVAVDKKRANGIKKLQQVSPGLDVILLDDAFQHRSVTPSLSILLTDFNSLYSSDLVLPTGTLREFSSGAGRADIIIVTKAPAHLPAEERKRITQKLDAKPSQRVYFSYIAYGEIMPVQKQAAGAKLEKDQTVVLLTGIANPAPLEQYVSGKVKNVVPVRFPDHHEYSAADLSRLQKIFDNIATGNKIVLTTEKDAMRLREPELAELITGLPLFYIPIEVHFHDKDGAEFDKQILDHVRANSFHNKIHPGAGSVHA